MRIPTGRRLATHKSVGFNIERLLSVRYVTVIDWHASTSSSMATAR
jgi:hypothetical protein